MKKVKKHWVVVSISSFALFGAASFTLMTNQVNALADDTDREQAAVVHHSTYASHQISTGVSGSSTSATVNSIDALSTSESSSANVQSSATVKSISDTSADNSQSSNENRLDTSSSNVQSSNSNNSLNGVGLSEAQSIIDQMASSAQSNIDSNAANYRSNLTQGLSYRDNFGTTPQTVYFNDANNLQQLGGGAFQGFMANNTNANNYQILNSSTPSANGVNQLNNPYNITSPGTTYVLTSNAALRQNYLGTPIVTVEIKGTNPTFLTPVVFYDANRNPITGTDGNRAIGMAVLNSSNNALQQVTSYYNLNGTNYVANVGSKLSMDSNYNYVVTLTPAAKPKPLNFYNTNGQLVGTGTVNINNDGSVTNTYTLGSLPTKYYYVPNSATPSISVDANNSGQYALIVNQQTATLKFVTPNNQILTDSNNNPLSGYVYLNADGTTTLGDTTSLNSSGYHVSTKTYAQANANGVYTIGVLKNARTSTVTFTNQGVTVVDANGNPYTGQVNVNGNNVAQLVDYGNLGNSNYHISPNGQLIKDQNDDNFTMEVLPNNIGKTLNATFVDRNGNAHGTGTIVFDNNNNPRLVDLGNLDYSNFHLANGNVINNNGQYQVLVNGNYITGTTKVDFIDSTGQAFGTGTVSYGYDPNIVPDFNEASVQDLHASLLDTNKLDSNYYVTSGLIKDHYGFLMYVAPKPQSADSIASANNSSAAAYIQSSKAALNQSIADAISLASSQANSIANSIASSNAQSLLASANSSAAIDKANAVNATLLSLQSSAQSVQDSLVLKNTQQLAKLQSQYADSLTAASSQAIIDKNNAIQAATDSMQEVNRETVAQVNAQIQTMLNSLSQQSLANSQAAQSLADSLRSSAVASVQNFAVDEMAKLTSDNQSLTNSLNNSYQAAIQSLSDSANTAVNSAAKSASDSMSASAQGVFNSTIASLQAEFAQSSSAQQAQYLEAFTAASKAAQTALDKAMTSITSSANDTFAKQSADNSSAVQSLLNQSIADSKAASQQAADNLANALSAASVAAKQNADSLVQSITDDNNSAISSLQQKSEADSKAASDRATAAINSAVQSAIDSANAQSTATSISNSKAVDELRAKYESDSLQALNDAQSAMSSAVKSAQDSADSVAQSVATQNQSAINSLQEKSQQDSINASNSASVAISQAADNAKSLAESRAAEESKATSKANAAKILDLQTQFDSNMQTAMTSATVVINSAVKSAQDSASFVAQSIANDNASAISSLQEKSQQDSINASNSAQSAIEAAVQKAQSNAQAKADADSIAVARSNSATIMDLQSKAENDLVNASQQASSAMNSAVKSAQDSASVEAAKLSSANAQAIEDLTNQSIADSKAVAQKAQTELDSAVASAIASAKSDADSRIAVLSDQNSQAIAAINAQRSQELNQAQVVLIQRLVMPFQRHPVLLLAKL